MSKKKRERHVLIGAMIVAGVITAGSTFAWFTSKDEVTNRLSASASYDVSIAEDFQPTEDWLPGQEINKDVSAVNTGSVDAFVRMWLGGAMRLLAEDATPSVDAKSASLGLAAADAVSDTDKVAAGLTYYKGGKYYKTLSTTQRKNPDLNGSTNDEDNNQPATFSEVQSMMAGGVLVYAPANASYTWTLEQATDLNVGTFATHTLTTVAKGTTVGSENSSAGTKVAGVSATDANYYGNIDASTFTPQSTGLYLFRRNVGETADGTANTYEYSGYYYDKDLDAYFALHTGAGANEHSDYVLPAGAVTDNSTATPSLDQVLPVTVAASKVYLYTASETLLDTDDLTWVYDATAGSEKFTVTYNGGTAADTTDDVVIDIALANIGSDSEQWTAIPDTAAPYKTTFYYNNDVEAGDTSRKLIDSLKLSEDTTQKAYLAFDFDLNVFLESVQVTMDEDGKEMITPVKPWDATEVTPATDPKTYENTGATVDSTDDYAKTSSGSEISVVGWKALS